MELKVMPSNVTLPLKRQATGPNNGPFANGPYGNFHSDQVGGAPLQGCGAMGYPLGTNPIFGILTISDNDVPDNQMPS